MKMLNNHSVQSKYVTSSPPLKRQHVFLYQYICDKPSISKVCREGTFMYFQDGLLCFVGYAEIKQNCIKYYFDIDGQCKHFI